MKIHELAKELNVKTTDLIKNLAEHGMKYYVASKVRDGDLEKIREIMQVQPEELVKPTEESKIPMNIPRGTFVGVLHDGNKYVSYHVRISEDELKNLIHQKLGEHGLVAGGAIELAKKFRKFMHEKFVDRKEKK